ncbi:hypothetical protein KKI23_01395 [Patescibacteria group bacterium]|nr:hypothetical protein [Patescibacteria group bacterium]
MKQKQDFLKDLEKKEKQIKQKIVATIVVFFMFMMVLGTTSQFNLIDFTQASSNMIQNVTPGSLAISSPAEIGFNDADAGVPASSLANLSMVNVQDYRGTGAGWAATGYSSVFANGLLGTVTIPNTRVYWDPDGEWYSYNSASNSDMDGHAGIVMLNTPQTILNAAAALGAGMGYYNIPNTTLNVVIQAADEALDYNATLTLTVS